MIPRLLMQCLKADFFYHDTRPLRFAVALTAVISSIMFLTVNIQLPGYTAWNIDDFVPSKCLPMIYGILGVLGMYYSSAVCGFTFMKSNIIKPFLFSVTHVGLAFINAYSLIAALILGVYTPFLPSDIVITLASLWVLVVHPFRIRTPKINQEESK